MMASRFCGTIRIQLFAVLLGLCVVVAGGCSKPEPKLVVGAETPTLPAADVAVRQVLAGLQRKDLRALWEFLPPSYQDDVEQLVHDFGERLDEKSWGPFVATCRKARLVTSHLVHISGDTANESDRESTARLREVESLLNALCESELSDVARLRQLDASLFLAKTGNRLLTAASQAALGDAGLAGGTFSQLGDVRVELSESVEETAVLTVEWPGQEPTQHRFVQIENRWIPRTLAEAWSTEFPKFREQCLAWADELRANPEPWHARLREMDDLLDELAATKSLAEARQVWQDGATRLAVAWFGVSIPEPSKREEIPVESSAPAKPVRVKKPDTEVLLPDEPEK